MLRVLLISDTHGNLDEINTLAKEKRADLVVHAGDFGFYLNKSLKRLSERELKLLVVHSPFREHFSEAWKRKDLENFVASKYLWRL